MNILSISIFTFRLSSNCIYIYKCFNNSECYLYIDFRFVMIKHAHSIVTYIKNYSFDDKSSCGQMAVGSKGYLICFFI